MDFRFVGFTYRCLKSTTSRDTSCVDTALFGSSDSHAVSGKVSTFLAEWGETPVRLDYSLSCLKFKETGESRSPSP